MKFEEMTQEQIDQAKACRTKEEIRAFIQDNHIDLSPEQMEQITGGYGDRETNSCGRKPRVCDNSPDGDHHWEYTGETRPGTVFRSLWPDYKHKCKYCHTEEWWWTK